MQNQVSKIKPPQVVAIKCREMCGCEKHRPPLTDSNNINISQVILLPQRKVFGERASPREVNRWIAAQKDCWRCENLDPMKDCQTEELQTDLSRSCPTLLNTGYLDFVGE